MIYEKWYNENLKNAKTDADQHAQKYNEAVLNVNKLNLALKVKSEAVLKAQGKADALKGVAQVDAAKVANDSDYNTAKSNYDQAKSEQDNLAQGASDADKSSAQQKVDSALASFNATTAKHEALVEDDKSLFIEYNAADSESSSAVKASREANLKLEAAQEEAKTLKTISDNAQKLAEHLQDDVKDLGEKLAAVIADIKEDAAEDAREALVITLTEKLKSDQNKLDKAITDSEKKEFTEVVKQDEAKLAAAKLDVENNAHNSHKSFDEVFGDAERQQATFKSSEDAINVNKGATANGLKGEIPYTLYDGATGNGTAALFSLDKYLCCNQHPVEDNAYVRTTVDVHYNINYDVKHLYTILHEIECHGGQCTGEMPDSSSHHHHSSH